METVLADAEVDVQQVLQYLSDRLALQGRVQHHVQDGEDSAGGTVDLDPELSKLTFFKQNYQLLF